jgi:hypothetical protein
VQARKQYLAFPAGLGMIAGAGRLGALVLALVALCLFTIAMMAIVGRDEDRKRAARKVLRIIFGREKAG